jgi:hypothetical protein
MKKLIFILALLTFASWSGLTAHAEIYWSETFDTYTAEWQCCLADCALNPGCPSGYSECHANTYGSPSYCTAITTDAARVAGTNKRGYRITLGANVFPTGENVLKKDLGSNKTLVYLRWYQRDSAPSSYSSFQKLFRMKQVSGQILIPEWQTNGGNVQMNLWDAATGSNHFFTGYSVNNAGDYTPGTWACYEIKMDLVNKAAEFWVNGVSKGTLNASSWWTTGWYIRNVEVGGNQYSHTVGATIDYDDIIVSDTYNGCGETPPGDTTPPVASSSSPYGSLLCTYNPLTIDLRSTWSEECTARYSTTNVTYNSMTGSMTRVAGTYDQYALINLPCGVGYTMYMGCRDAAGNTGYTSTSFTILPDLSIPLNPGTVGVGSGGAFAPGSGGSFIQN